MFPVTDTPRRRRFPIVNLSLIVACFAVFLYELTLGTEVEVTRFFTDWGVVPKQLTDWANDPSASDLGEPITLVSSAFLHGGWLHLLGNMLYLWVFGDNIEDALGHVPYLAFYLVGGIGAAITQVAIDTNETAPMVGASGAIAAVLGSYLVLYPRATVGLLVFIVVLPLPAFALIIIWFGMQLFSGVATIGETEATQAVAFWAHIGGFVTGLVVTLVFRPLIHIRSRDEMASRYAGRRRIGAWR